jgi:hypothetical protein
MLRDERPIFVMELDALPSRRNIIRPAFVLLGPKPADSDGHDECGQSGSALDYPLQPVGKERIGSPANSPLVRRQIAFLTMITLESV